MRLRRISIKIKQIRLYQRYQLTWEPSAVVVAVFLETKVSSLVVDTNLSLVLEIICHCCEVGRAKGVGDAHFPGMPIAIVCQFGDGISFGLCQAL
jgi:hypothetical protein